MIRYEIALHQDYRELFTLNGLAAAAGVHPGLIERYVDYGLLEPVQILNGEMFFSTEAVPRLRMIQRLRLDVGVSLPGIAIILDLTDKVRRLQYEVECLRQERF